MFDTGTEVDHTPSSAAPADRTDLDDRCRRVIEIQAERAVLDAEEADLLASLEHDGTCDARYGLSTAGWLAREARLPRAEAVRRVRVAVALDGPLPLTAEALAEGELPWHHAHVLARAANPRVAGAMSRLEAELLASAEGTSFERWRSEVLALVDLLDADGGHDPSGDADRDRLHLSRGVGGTLELTGRLVGERADCVRHALESKADELFHRARVDHDVDPSLRMPSRAHVMADALAELCHDGLAIDRTTSRPPRPEVILVVGADDHDAPATTLHCDADVYPVIVDSLGGVLDAGRRLRHPSRALRRAIDVRDGGCVFPGCDRPPGWCDAHHPVPVRLGGETTVANLALLCRHHHRVVHRPGWRLRLDEHQRPWITSPSGAYLGQRDGRVVVIE